MNQTRSLREHFLTRALPVKIRASGREVFGYIFFGGVYWLSIRFGLLMTAYPERVACIWLASGVALAALLLNPRSRWLKILSIIFIVNVAGNWSGGNPLGASLGFALANMLEAALCAWLLEYACKEKVTFTRPAHVIYLVAGAVFFNGATAVLGALVSAWSFGAPFISTWRVWWAADGLGIILVTPLIVLWRVRADEHTKWRLLEFSLCVFMLTLFAWLLFGPFTHAEEPIFRNYMLFPLLIWLAFRFTPRDMINALMFFSVIAMWHTLQGHGIFSFADQSRAERLVALQIYLGVAAFSGLLLSAMVAERKKVGAALQESEQLYHAAFEKNRAVKLLIDPTDGRIIDANPAAAEFYGYSLQQIKTLNVSYLNTLPAAQIKEEMTKAISEKQSYFTFCHRLANGEIRDVEVYSSPLQIGGRVLLHSIIHDITKRKRIEDALQESEELFSLFMRYSPIYVFIKEVTPTESRVLHASDNFYDMIRIPGFNMTGKTMEELFPPELAAKFTTDDWNVVSSGAVLKLDEELNGRSYTTVKFPITLHNKTLLAGYTIDITERKRMEDVLRANEEKYRTVANFTYDWEAWHAPHGEYIYVSPSCERITGYTAEEFMNDANLIITITHSEDRERVATHFYAEENHEDTNGLLDFRIVAKNGEIRWIDHTCVAVYGQDGQWLGRRESNRDITFRKRDEGVLRSRLWLSKFADTHSVGELLQSTLNEAEALTNSQIGFFHSLDADQKTLTLQMWSTNTLQNMCNAEGAGMHYSIDQAGVWVDCVRQREPVIHNDYVNLPHRKGLPQGHAAVTRILVVPIFRNELIVAIFGVGNKQTNYNEHDIKTVSQIADLAWDVVLRKRSEEEVRQTKAELELALAREKHLSHTDPLTGVNNRRYLYEIAANAFDMAFRHNLPLSVMMIDIDHFKQVNDTYGHDIGDQVLLRVVQVICSELRSTDVIGRYGGEEFVVILPMTTAPQARAVAERIRASVEFTRVSTPKEDAAVTVSIGVAEAIRAPSAQSANLLEAAESLDNLIRRADGAMYHSKHAGRNCVTLFEE